MDSTADTQSNQQPLPNPALPQQVTQPESKPQLKRTSTAKVVVKKGKEVLVSKSRMDLFLEEYIANGGNGTEAALKIFNPKNRASAAAMASVYLQRAKSVNKAILEKKGITYGVLVDLIYKRAHDVKDPTNLIDRLLKMGGYEDFLSKGPVTTATVNVLNVQKGLIDDYVDGEYVEDGE